MPYCNRRNFQFSIVLNKANNTLDDAQRMRRFLLIILLLRDSSSFHTQRPQSPLTTHFVSTSTSFPGDRASNNGKFLDDLVDELKRESDEEDANERMLRERQERLRDRETLTKSRQYELTLKRPLGFSIGQQSDGFIIVTEIKESIASNLVKHAVAVGDRVVAIESALGGKLWPVSTVEGAISAVTGRIPGTSVAILFEKMNADTTVQQSTESNKPVDVATPVFTSKVSPSTSTGKVTYNEAPASSLSVKSRLDLVRRCRDVLRRYANADEDRKNVSIQMTALVADKVVDALASASMSLDPLTLSMIMKFYITSERPESAIRLFEAATGFAGDGSSRPCKVVIAGKSGGQIIPSEAALNLYTGTNLMQAQAALGDLDAVFCTLAALEGRTGELEGRLESAPWPWTGTYGSIQPDTYTYNVAIAAAAKAGGVNALLRGLDVFSNMKDPSKVDGKFSKNEVTYNTLISALSAAGRPEAAFALLNEMKKFGLRPDKFTYTSLIRACEDEDDVQELLFDMKERGIASDVVTYNTMIQSLCNKGKLVQATKLVTDMELKRISPNAKTYSLIMNGLLKSNKPEACLRLFESASVNPKTSELMDNVQVCTTAIAASAMMKDYERGLEIVARMSAKGVKPNLQTYTAVMGACIVSGRADLAAKVFQKIENPDGYAIKQAIRSNCMVGKTGVALEMLQANKKHLKGKEAMTSFKSIVHESLRHDQYDVAREAMTAMLKSGFVPSKSLLYAVFNTLALSNVNETVDLSVSSERFRFLLFLIDSLSQRNMPIESALYVATLAYGAKLGGQERFVAAFIAEAKQQQGSGRIIVLEDNETTSTVATEEEPRTWEKVCCLFKAYCHFAHQLLFVKLFYDLEHGSLDEHTAPSLPRIQVRTLPVDAMKLLRTEQTVLAMKQKKKHKRSV